MGKVPSMEKVPSVGKVLPVGAGLPANCPGHCGNLSGPIPTPGYCGGVFASKLAPTGWAHSHRQSSLPQGDYQDASGDTIPRRDASSAASARLEIFSLL